MQLLINESGSILIDRIRSLLGLCKLVVLVETRWEVKTLLRCKVWEINTISCFIKVSLLTLEHMVTSKTF